ncbi:DNA damage-induced cell division inhibitor SosA [Staphylococcus kloosii]|jgi:uncharacterized protein YpmS|uniref:Uncharacterized protein n=1 Tax=Staphylococcus kloosii TaxID=29384 RepID=A0A151A5J6_9STAP|nr:DNA damage-induced cell division inhibitor SosA [Staphylococcus kloosii]AVQ36292.1 hypothetical protein C7J89_09120 [Staphylococcus kloosii]KYH14593.1 hypothetical protein A0131_07370 [Staphylococcus kloosii]MBF7022189.1 hypothetical protein [Staphylococcus kloosii]MBF7029224.1 hypothetical protein [Staphylococcus kloosii]MCD8878535.1 hypothetical protein [Staphylococcus kloosii]
MTKQYINQYKTYLIVLLATMILCTIFLLSVDFNNKSEQTYEMTDHKITNQSKGTLANKAKDDENSDKNDEHTPNQTIAIIR